MTPTPAQQLAARLRELTATTLAPNGKPWSAPDNSIRALTRAIKAHNGGSGPSHETMTNLLDGTRTANPSPAILLPIARFFGITLAELGIQADPATELLELAERIPQLRRIALALADLRDEDVENFELMIVEASMSVREIDRASANDDVPSTSG